mmetsp:Transcript_34612/g.72953  ORF Transcript_34612/g.72953 Transcript_34612/m.72953 type:complete len:101 (+) Transcript_34612:637-939(+)
MKRLCIDVFARVDQIGCLANSPSWPSGEYLSELNVANCIDLRTQSGNASLLDAAVDEIDLEQIHPVPPRTRKRSLLLARRIILVCTEILWKLAVSAIYET